MKFSALIVTVIVAVTGTALMMPVANSQDAGADSRQGKREESARKIKELQNERLATLRGLAADTSALYRNARVEADRAHDAQRQLIRAEVELAENDADRIKLYETFVNVMKDYEEIATVRLQGARGTRAAILEAKAMRLEGEIALEQLRAAASK